MHTAPQRSRTAQRSLVATLEIVAFAAGAHVLAGGSLPAPGFLLALGAVVLAGSYLTLARRLHAAVVLPVVLAAQVGLHAAFEAVGTQHLAMGSGPAGAGMSMGAPMAPMPHAMPLHLTPTMIWAHLITTVLTAILLLSQERVLAVLTTFLRDLVLAPVPAGARGRRPAAAPYAGPRSVLLRTSPRRGPPTGLLATS